MSTEQLRQVAAQGGGMPARKPENFPAMLQAYSGEIARALPKHLSGDRMLRVALTAFRQNPALGQCDPTSVFAAVICAAQMGLEPGIMGQGYLIPYGKTCQFVPGWQGLVDIAQRSGRCSIRTGAVFEGDTFDYKLGLRQDLNHIPVGEDDPAKLTHVYAIGEVNGSTVPNLEVWTIDKVWRHRDRYNKVGQRHYSFKHPEMYARKVVLLQVLKYMPKSIELANAVRLEEMAQTTGQSMSVKEAIDGAFTEMPADPDPSAPFDSAESLKMDAALAEKEKGK